jgi:hypothetical protein
LYLKFTNLIFVTRVAEFTLRAEGTQQKHEWFERLKGAGKVTMEAVSQMMEAQFDMMCFQMGRITDALCRSKRLKNFS